MSLSKEVPKRRKYMGLNKTLVKDILSLFSHFPLRCILHAGCPAFPLGDVPRCCFERSLPSGYIERPRWSLLLPLPFPFPLDSPLLLGGCSYGQASPREHFPVFVHSLQIPCFLPVFEGVARGFGFLISLWVFNLCLFSK